MLRAEKLKICVDFDDTLVPSTYKYHGPTWRCGLIISRALGHKSPYPVETLKLHAETDIEMVKTLGFSPDRFPGSWVRTYEIIAERAGVPAEEAVKKALIREARKFKAGPYQPFPGAKKALREIQRDGHSLHLVTAGDDALQRSKIDESGLGKLFDSIHVTGTDKEPALAAIVGDRPDLGVMVGDSKKSDIAPAVRLGMTAVWVPSQTWAFAHAELDPSSYHEVPSVREVPALIRGFGDMTKRRPR